MPKLFFQKKKIEILIPVGVFSNDLNNNNFDYFDRECPTS